ncbi:MAG: hypothetical protein N3A53_06885, partial [Verrucomicrobiae bacterium]|nr:hypothetical protein [Verrucomicrobiae bacterium]
GLSRARDGTRPRNPLSGLVGKGIEWYELMKARAVRDRFLDRSIEVAMPCQGQMDHSLARACCLGQM